MILREQIDEYIANQPEGERGEVQELHGIISGVMPECKLWFLDGKDGADLVDGLELMIFPITLGPGKRLFADGTLPASFKVTESQITPNGVIIANYERDGDVKTGARHIEEND